VHRFRVQASNSAGAAGEVESATVIPFTSPDPSQASLTLTAQPRAVQTRWEGVADNSVARGSPVTRVEVRARPISGSTRTCTATAPRQGVVPATCTVTNLVAGGSYTLDVRITNSAGASAWQTIGTIAAD
jgi:hypothetical protein